MDDYSKTWQEAEHAAEDSLKDAQRKVIAACAFKLAAIDEHKIDISLFDDPAYELAFIGLQVFRRQYPAAEQAAASGYIRLVNQMPELCGQFSDEVLSLDEIPAMFDSGSYDIGFIKGNVDTLKEAAFQAQRRDKLAQLERLPRERFLRELKEWLPELAATGTAAEYNVVTAHELATNDYPLEYMIPGLLVQGQPAVIGGGKKSLKTTLLVDLALSLASKSKFLNEFYVTRKYRVGLMSGESGAATIKETAERIAKSKPWVHLNDYTDLVFSFELPKLGKPDTAENLVRLIKTYALEVLCIDPLYLAMQAGDGASNLYSMGDKLSPLAEVIAETGCTIILAHHARKIAKSDFARFSPPELDDLAFAGISEFARQWLLLNRREEYNPEVGGHHELWLAAGGSAGHSGLWALSVDEGTRLTPGGRFWQVSVSKASEARKEKMDAKEADRNERRQRDESKLLDAYKLYPGGETAKQLRLAAGMNPDRFETTNFALRQREVVVPHSVVKNKKPNAGFILKEYIKTYQGNEGNEGNESGVVPVVPVGEAGERNGSLFREPSSSVPLTDDMSGENHKADNHKNRSPHPEDAADNLKPNGKRRSSKKPAATRKAGA